MIILYTLIAVIGGISLAVQGPVNAGLGKKTNTFQATLVSFAGGTVVLTILTLLFGKGDLTALAHTAPWKCIGGIYGAINVCVSVAVMPVLGVALALTANMLGQLVSAMLIDTLGLFETEVVPVSPLRLAGIAVATVGIVLIYVGGQKAAKKRSAIGDCAERAAANIIAEGKTEGKTEINTAEKTERNTAGKTELNNRKKIIMLILMFASGLLGAMQTATNGALSAEIGTIEGTLVSFVAGLICIFIVVMIYGKGKLAPVKGKQIKPWQFMGGLLGAAGIFINILTVSLLGTALQTISSLIGQMAGGLIIDSTGILEAQKVKANAWRVSGVIVIAVGVLLVSIAKAA